MFYLDATNKIASVKPEPAVAAPGDTITLSAYVTDESNEPVSGVTVTWLNMKDDTDTSTSDTDSSGIATLDVERDTTGVQFYQVYLGSDTADAVEAEACFYGDSLDNTLVVPNGMDGVLDEYDVGEGVQAIIGRYDSAFTGDYITFWWDNIHSYSLLISDPDTDFPITIDISNNFPPACLADGDYQVFYQYRDESQNNYVSAPLAISVAAGALAPTLAAPTFEDGEDGWINIDEASGGTNLQIAYEGMAAGDILDTTWQLYDEDHMEVLTAKLDSYTVLSTDLETGYCLVLVPEDDIPAVQRGSAQAWYQMTPVNGGSIQSSEVGEIGVDTVA